jgi:hypothetical protein
LRDQLAPLLASNDQHDLVLSLDEDAEIEEENEEDRQLRTESGLRLFFGDGPAFRGVARALYDGGFRPPIVGLLDRCGWNERVVRTPLVWNAPIITVESQVESWNATDFVGGGFMNNLNSTKMKNNF